MVNIMTYYLVNKESGGIYGCYNSKDEAEKQLEEMPNKEEWYIE